MWGRHRIGRWGMRQRWTAELQRAWLKACITDPCECRSCRMAAWRQRGKYCSWWSVCEYFLPSTSEGRAVNLCSCEDTGEHGRKAEEWNAVMVSSPSDTYLCCPFVSALNTTSAGFVFPLAEAVSSIKYAECLVRLLDSPAARLSWDMLKYMDVLHLRRWMSFWDCRFPMCHARCHAQAWNTVEKGEECRSELWFRQNHFR